MTLQLGSPQCILRVFSSHFVFATSALHPSPPSMPGCCTPTCPPTLPPKYIFGTGLGDYFFLSLSGERGALACFPALPLIFPPGRPKVNVPPPWAVFLNPFLRIVMYNWVGFLVQFFVRSSASRFYFDRSLVTPHASNFFPPVGSFFFF